MFEHVPGIAASRLTVRHVVGRKRNRLATPVSITIVSPMRTELVTTLKRQATRILADLHESKDPILITEHGTPSAYLVDVSSFELMQDRMEILEGIARGERAVLERRTLTQAEAKRRMKKWLA